MDPLPPDSSDPKAVNPEAQRIGRELRTRREERRISVRELASRLGVSEPYVYLLETGRKQLHYDMALKMAKELRIDEERLVNWVKQHRPRSYLAALEGHTESPRRERHPERDRTDPEMVEHPERRPPLDSARAYLEHLEQLRTPRRRQPSHAEGIPVPLFEAGRLPFEGSEVEDYIPLHPSLLPTRTMQRDLFAYTVDWRMARRVPDAITEYDIVVLTRDAMPSRPRAVYAVDMYGVVELARVSMDHDGLVVEGEPQSPRERQRLALEAGAGGRHAHPRILGRVIAIIRRMR